jgi:hypothetical protein
MKQSIMAGLLAAGMLAAILPGAAAAGAPSSLMMSFGCRSSDVVAPPSGPVPIPYPNLGVLVHDYRGACHPVGVQFVVID